MTETSKLKVNIKVEFESYSDTKTSIICDTNVWYGFNQGNPTEIEENFTLTPTLLTLAELGTSKVIAHDLSLFQSTIKAIYNNGGAIIATDPIAYTLSQQDINYPINLNGTKKLLEIFSKVMSLKIDEIIEIDDDLKKSLLKSFQHDRNDTVAFANFGNSKLENIRRNINTQTGKKKHIQIDSLEIIKDMVKSIFNDYLKDKNYTINWNIFNWDRIEFFLKITETFFKKLETTKGMKIKPNDGIDWFNTLYVGPEDKYLTLDGPWRKYIENDERINRYLYK